MEPTKTRWFCSKITAMSDQDVNTITIPMAKGNPSIKDYRNCKIADIEMSNLDLTKKSIAKGSHVPPMESTLFKQKKERNVVIKVFQNMFDRLFNKSNQQAEQLRDPKEENSINLNTPESLRQSQTNPLHANESNMDTLSNIKNFRTKAEHATLELLSPHLTELIENERDNKLNEQNDETPIQQQAFKDTDEITNLRVTNNLSYLFKPCTVEVCKYNFMTALRHKLDAFTNTELYGKTIEKPHYERAVTSTTTRVPKKEESRTVPQTIKPSYCSKDLKTTTPMGLKNITFKCPKRMPKFRPTLARKKKEHSKVIEINEVLKLDKSLHALNSEKQSIQTNLPLSSSSYSKASSCTKSSHFKWPSDSELELDLKSITPSSLHSSEFGSSSLNSNGDLNLFDSVDIDELTPRDLNITPHQHEKQLAILEEFKENLKRTLKESKAQRAAIDKLSNENLKLTKSGKSNKNYKANVYGETTKNVSKVAKASYPSKDCSKKTLTNSHQSKTLKQKIQSTNRTSTTKKCSVSCSSMELEKLLSSETSRSESLTAVLKMREKSIIDRTKGQFAWLEFQKQRFKSQGLLNEIAAIKKKQNHILLKMEKERKIIKRVLESALSSPSIPTITETSSHQQNAVRQSLSAPALRANRVRELTNASFLQRREEDIRQRLEHVEHILEWHLQLDQKEAEVIELERKLFDYNERNGTTETATKRSVTHRVKNLECRLVDIADKIALENSMQVNAVKSEKHNTPELEPNLMHTTGSKLNKLWRRLTSQKLEKFEPKRRYKLTKSDLERLYDEAKLAVLNDFANVVEERSVTADLMDTSTSSAHTSSSQVCETSIGSAGDLSVSRSSNDDAAGVKSHASSPIVPSLDLNFSTNQSEDEQEAESFKKFGNVNTTFSLTKRYESTGGNTANNL